MAKKSDHITIDSIRRHTPSTIDDITTNEPERGHLISVLIATSSHFISYFGHERCLFSTINSRPKTLKCLA